MNNDTIVYPHWLEEMITVARQDPRIGLVNPLWTVPKRFVGGRQRYISTVVNRNAGRYMETDWARGFCFLVRRAVIDKIGGIDEAYAPGYFDDWDYSVRAIRAGFKCARALGAFVWHYKNVTYGLEFLTESMRLKGKIFYSRYGMPLRIMLVLDDVGEPLAKEYICLMRAILDEQNRLTLITTAGFPVYPAHTNLRLKRIKTNLLLRAYVVWHLWRNLRYAKSRRYDMIICSGKIQRWIYSCPHISKSYKDSILSIEGQSYDNIISTITKLKYVKNESIVTSG